MQQGMKKYLEKKQKALFYGGLIIVLLQLVPFLILGEGSVIPYHDQLDGEMIAYILQAKWLFSGEILPEFMNGALKTALTLPAPGFVCLFRMMSPFWAYVCMQGIEIVVAYVGMYLLSKEVHAGEFMAILIAGVFAYLPFFPLYGLSQFGIPLLIWFYLRVKKYKNYAGAIIYGIIYAILSSLVLVGFGVLGILTIELIIWLARERFKFNDAKDKKSFGVLLATLFAMGVVYILENYRLIFQMFGIGKAGQVISHKSEYVFVEGNFWDSLFNMLFRGGSHSEDLHFYIMLVTLAGITICIFIGRRTIEKNGWKQLIKVYSYIFTCILLAAFWESGLSVLLKKHIGFLGGLQFGRVMWIVPSLWYFTAAIVVGMLGKVLKEKTGKARYIVKFAMAFFVVGMSIIGVKLIWNGTYPANVCRMIGREYSSISFEEYYAVGVLEQVKDYIYETTGETQDEYKVISLGIDPGAAYYHGFYCLDGYSNNYSAEYKHKFREIIAPELEKNEYLRESFDNWGNRCYLWCAQSPGYYNFEKYTAYFWNFEIDSQAAKKLGAKYILSAVYLTNAEEIGLKRVREEAFETPESYYAIYLYEIE